VQELFHTRANYALNIYFCVTFVVPFVFTFIQKEWKLRSSTKVPM